MNRLWVVLLAGSVGCVGTTQRVAIERSAPVAATTVTVAVNITVGQPLLATDARIALAQHGRWQSTSLGDVWIPAVAEREEFVPFVTHGQWAQSERGPRWASEFSWGPIVFHYGRWVRVGALWAWRYDGDYAMAPVSWRTSGAHVGWSPLGSDEWCWLAFEELYAPMPARRSLRGRAAAPVAATSVESPAPGYTPGVGWGPPGGPPSSNRDTTQAHARLEQAPAEPRWGTVIIRDEAANDRFEELQQYEHSAPATVSSDARTVAPVVSDIARARSSPAATRAPSPASTASTSTLWGDQERTRAPVVANVQPRFVPFAQRVVLSAPMAPTAPMAPIAPNREPAQQQPPMIVPSGGGGGLPAGAPVAVARPATTVATVPSSPVRTLIPTVSEASNRTTIRR